MILLLLACSSHLPGPLPRSGSFTLLHTNDTHAHILPEPAPWLEGTPAIGGFIGLDAEVRHQRAQGSPVLLLDAGDIETGTPLSELEVDGVRGAGMLRLMEAVGYDAWTIGNHEFDAGADALAELILASKIPVLAANLEAPGGGPAFEGVSPYTVLGAGELRVGVIGVTSEGLDHLAPLSVRERAQATDVGDAVRAQIEVLGDQVDLIVVLSHIGVDEDRALAAEVPEIDVIVGGHSHTALLQPERIGQTWVVQAGSYTRSLGVLHLDVVDGQVDAADGRLIDLDPLGPGASEEVRGLVGEYKTKIEEYYGEVITTSTLSLSRDYQAENGMGDWLTDLMREATGADVALYNNGGIRADLAAGPITLGDLYEVLPFDNQVTEFGLSGEALVELMLDNVRTFGSDRGGMSVSGMQIRFRGPDSNPRLVEATINGAPLEPKRIYRVVSNSYVVERSDRYLGGAVPQDPRSTGQTVFELVEGEVRRVGIRAPTGERMVRVD